MKTMEVWERWQLRRGMKQKTKEFHRLGYLNMTEAELWEYMQEKVWHHDWSTKEKRQSVLIITPNDFFDYQRVKAQVKDVLSFDWEDIDDLL